MWQIPGKPDDGYGCVHLDTVIMAVLVGGSQVSWKLVANTCVVGKLQAVRRNHKVFSLLAGSVSISLECSVSCGVFLKGEVSAGQ